MNTRHIYEAISELARRVESRNGIEGDIKRLSREQYRANTLAEQQHEQTRQALDLAEQMLEELKAEHEKQISAARLEVIKELFPVLDSIEAGVTSGVAQIKALMDDSPETARGLAAWLDGQRLLRDRLLAILAEEDVELIPSKGLIFDPLRHIAVKVAWDPARPSGQIISVQRQGYARGDIILRYAEVIVNRTEEEDIDGMSRRANWTS